MISKKNDEKCFCAKAELFDEYIKKTGVTVLNSIVEESGMNPSDFIFALRNSLIDFVTEKENSDEIGETIRDSFYAFLREDFNYLNSEEGYCVERRFKKLLEMAVDSDNDQYVPRLLRQWDRWFAPDKNISNQMYETYDFMRSEHIILYAIKTLDLPPYQAEYVDYYLRMKRSSYQFTKNEFELLKIASINILSYDGMMCKIFDELLKS